MKKFLVTILTIVLSFTCLVGCSPDESAQNVQTVTHENISFEIPDNWDEDKAKEEGKIRIFYTNKDSEDALELYVLCLGELATDDPSSSVKHVVSQFQSKGSIPEDAEISDIKIDGIDGNLIKYSSELSTGKISYCKEIIFCTGTEVYVLRLYSEKESVGNSEIESIAKSIKMSSPEE